MERYLPTTTSLTLLIFFFLVFFLVFLGALYITNKTERGEESKPIPLPCRTWQSLYTNRPIPAIHSYARPARMCEIG